MSEYQYHEWQAADRLLTPKEQEAVSELSSHIDVTSSRAEVTYNWGDFKHDPKQVMLKYFDAYLCLANWGSLRLMFRVPKGLIAEADIEPYRLDEEIGFETIGAYHVFDLDFNFEDGGRWVQEEANLSQFISLRTDLIEGDYRLLYLAWLKAMSLHGDEDESETEPPVPWPSSSTRRPLFIRTCTGWRKSMRPAHP